MSRPESKKKRPFQSRILVVLFLMCVVFGVIFYRLYSLQIFQHIQYADQGRRIYQKSEKITPLRGSIFSRRGTPLATSTYRQTAYLSTRAIQLDAHTEKQLARALAHCLDLPFDRVYKQLQGGGHIPLARKIPDEKVVELMGIREAFDLGRNAIYLQQEGKRLYPKGRLASHVVGFTQPDDYGDNIGLTGIEALHQEEIAGSYRKETIQSNVMGLELTPVEEEALLEAMGNDVYLTIDEAIQHYAESALEKQIRHFEARAGVCVVMEIQTGAILAMASLPNFDLNAPGRSDRSHLTNRCLLHAIPPGSVMKIFAMAALLEENLVSPYEIIDCHQGQIRYPGRSRPIRDSHPLGLVPVHEAFAESSNVAFTLLGQRMDKPVLYGHLRNFGFGRKTEVDLTGEATGIMRPLSQWTRQSMISLSIGYEITVTPVQVAAAAAAIANDGFYMRPHVLKEIRSPRGKLLYQKRPEKLRRVCSPHTSEILLGLLEEVVDHGTATEAAIPGYRVGGKTGTTVQHVPTGRHNINRSYYSSFLGILPLNHPRLVIYTWVDDPNPEKGRYGGDVAVPIFRSVAAHSMRVLGIAPTEPVQTAQRPAPVLVQASETEPLTPADIARAGDVMPDLTGLTLREVAKELQALRMDARLMGSGVVVRQQPLPGKKIPCSTRGLVILEPHPELRAEEEKIAQEGAS